MGLIDNLAFPGAGLGAAIYGKTTSGIGVFGDSTSTGIGVIGVANGAGTRGYGSSVGGNSVTGRVFAAGATQVVAGVFGDSTTTYGVIGRTTKPGYSGLTAITGISGVAALAATSTNANAYAAYFTGTTVVQGNFAVVSGAKSAAVRDASGQHRLVYCVESPEAWFEDFGTGTLVNGVAQIARDTTFTEIVHTDAYHVFLTPCGNFHAHVARQTAAGFAVQQTTGTGSAGASGTFSCRVVARRGNITGERLAKFAVPKVNLPTRINSPSLSRPKEDRAFHRPFRRAHILAHPGAYPPRAANLRTVHAD